MSFINSKSNRIFALVDCNNFFASCECVFRPDLWDKPIVVLSNNDGNIIARSDESKALGIKMAEPYFKVKTFLKKNGVEVFSSNYTLYGDMSHRVMSVLKHFESDVEVYSIDEAFISLPADKKFNFTDYGQHIKAVVQKWAGLPVSIRFAHTKTLAKIAGRIEQKMQAMGVDLQLVTSDGAYHDKDGSLFRETGVTVTTPPSSKVLQPEHINGATGTVFCHGSCAIPMSHLGVEEQSHEYKCGAHSGECHHSSSCPQYRLIPMDSGLFQRVPYHVTGMKKALDIRKNCERPFNLLKNQTGLETVRVRSQSATIARCTIGSIAVLLIKMAGIRKKQAADKPKQTQMFKTAA